MGIRSRLAEFTPKSIECLREGYTKETFLGDIFAGVSVGVIALPLALAFAIASGVLPEQGLFTAIVAGFMISLLGGSRVQIGGPTGAYVVVVYGILHRHGYDGLALATLIAAVMLVLMGLFRFGILLKYIPYPVTTGFTTGIAVVIVSSQIKDFFGLDAAHVPAAFIEKCVMFCRVAHTWSGAAFTIATSTVILLFVLRRFLPKWPGAIIAISLATMVAYFFGLPVETIESKFGGIPRTLPIPVLPTFSWELFKQVFPDAITVALLGAIESLLSAVVADGMTGHKHKSNLELIAQGLANIGSVLFKGIPATGAIARTSANIRMGAKTPLAGMIHAITLLLLMLVFAPLAGVIPLAALAGVLIFVAWNMAEIPHFVEILKGQKGDATILLVTFLLTVLIDLAVAVQVGVVLAAMLFIKRMTDTTSVKICQTLLKRNNHEHSEANDDDLLLQKDIPSNTAVFEITGPFFYAVADLLEDELAHLDKKPQFFLLRMHKTPLIDATGLKAIRDFAAKCHKKEIHFLISDITPEIRTLFSQAGIEAAVGKYNLFSSFNEALKKAKTTDFSAPKQVMQLHA